MAGKPMALPVFHRLLAKSFNVFTCNKTFSKQRKFAVDDTVF